MRCPNCPDRTPLRRVRRLGIYPVPVMWLQLGYYVALLWVLGRKWRWVCPSCGAQFDRHSIFSRIYRMLFWIGLAAVCLLIVFGALMIFL